ncbi:hypothetical protein [Pseudomonas fluorescens]|uniref:hypothetical protein n=1 Tax=Pseudomonas fluorescens TaxID=294 RepID=UPI000A95485D|nr:hypothetical protein [Pseudomonas fluorescens]
MAPSENKSDPLNLNIQRSMVALSVLGSVLVLIWLLKYSAYGIDFTDEGFYLVWISNPFIYSGSITQFGFIYHPLYSLLGGDISAIRQANILITFTLAWCLVNAFLASLVPEIKEGRFTLLVASAGLAISALTLFDSWLPTPNYNSLNLQALLVSATGMVLSEKKPHRKSIIGWILIGVGGWLTFMAKPSTALALALGTLFYLLFSRKFSVRMLFLALATATTLLLVSAFAIDGSVLQFLKRLQLGMEFSKYLGGGHTPAQILRIDNFHLDKRAKTALIITFGAVFIALWSTSTRSKKISIAGLLISLSLLILTASLTLGQVQRAAGFGQFQGLLVFALVYAAIATGLLLGKFKALESIPAPQWAIAALFMGMPHIYAFGTNRNYWQTGSSAAIFWLLAGVVVLGPLIRERASWLLLLPLTFATQAVTATLLQTGIEQPQRQPQPLRLLNSTHKCNAHPCMHFVRRLPAQALARA